MTIQNYNQALYKLRENNIDVEEPIKFDLALISELERRFGHLLPNSYKQMLRDYGSLEFDATEIYGITINGLDGNSIPNVVFVTEADRSRGEISDKMVEIMVTGYGPYFVLDCGQLDQRGEAPVYEINELGYKHGMKKVADSFGEFLLSEVNMMLQNR
jgi:SMI1-KNR4 cell-wall